MKQLWFQLLLLWTLLAMNACSPNTGDEFIGKWKSVDLTEPLVIERTDNNYILTQKGQPDLLATYDADAHRLLVDVGSAKVPIIYLPDSDELLTSTAARSTRFSRVK